MAMSVWQFRQFDHGTDHAYEYRGCRCDRCRRAHADRVARTRAKAATRLTPDDPRHGTRNAFDNLGCRCDRCREAKSAAGRAYHAARKVRS